MRDAQNRRLTNECALRSPGCHALSDRPPGGGAGHVRSSVRDTGAPTPAVSSLQIDSKQHIFAVSIGFKLDAPSTEAIMCARLAPAGRKSYRDDPQVRRLGKHHPDVATTLAATAGLLKAMGRMADAETVYRLVRAPRPWQCSRPACVQSFCHRLPRTCKHGVMRDDSGHRHASGSLRWGSAV